jgi:type I restriction enzyme M protein
MITPRQLTQLYSKAHDLMRNIDGLQPQESFDELLKYMFFRQMDEDGFLFTGGSYTSDQIQKRFSSHLKGRNSWTTEIWKDRKFHLSEGALSHLHQIFADVRFSDVAYDVRASAMRQFLTPDIRKGLGIYLTPDEVVREVILFLDPVKGSRMLDPACGSGTFLSEAARHWRSQGTGAVELWASDKNPRMLLLAELNLEHHTDIVLHKKLMDSLANLEQAGWERTGLGSFDYVVTNPPFGVNLDSRSVDLSQYVTGTDENGYTLKKQQSEIVFLERCLQLLKPGGKLAIVLPKSAMTNTRLDIHRQRLGKIGYVYAAISLPPETFAAYGTQTNTFVLFVEKFPTSKPTQTSASIPVAHLSNVGYDLTGRPRAGNQLTGVHKALSGALHGEKDELIKVYSGIPINDTFSIFSASGSSKEIKPSGRQLSELAEVIKTGKTPARSAYVDNGLFIIKVGNLTGAGIDWIARERNFVDAGEARKRTTARKPLIVQEHDIVLTSSAHSPVYIAKKVDIVTKIPTWVNGRATFVGEVMLIRVKAKAIDPFSLLAFLRHPKTVAQIQQMVRGQTAHLHPEDIGNLHVPDEVIQRADDEVTALVREEAQLSERLNEVAWRQMRCADQLVY